MHKIILNFFKGGGYNVYVIVLTEIINFVLNKFLNKIIALQGGKYYGEG